jgi:hypothetical protein
MESLTPLERQVLDMFLSGDHPVLEALRAQAAAALVASREYTGVGVYVNLTVPDAVAIPAPSDLVFGDVNLELQNAEPGIAVLLYVQGGYLSFLELVTPSTPWPEDPVVERITYFREVPVTPGGFSLVPSVERDPNTLARALRGRHETPAA